MCAGHLNSAPSVQAKLRTREQPKASFTLNLVSLRGNPKAIGSVAQLGRGIRSTILFQFLSVSLLTEISIAFSIIWKVSNHAFLV